jgi:hypothetical protein
MGAASVADKHKYTICAVQQTELCLPRLFKRTVMASLPCYVMCLSTDRVAYLRKLWSSFRFVFMAATVNYLLVYDAS